MLTLRKGREMSRQRSVLESAKKSGVWYWRPSGVSRVEQLAGSIALRGRSQTYFSLRCSDPRLFGALPLYEY
jgi:hypothetical protein